MQTNAATADHFVPQVGFIVHGRPAGNADTKDPNNSPERFFTPIDRPEIWLKAGDPTFYFSPPP